MTPGNQLQSSDCSDGFFLDADINICRPTCGEFFPTPLVIQIIIDIFIVVCIIASVIVFILALTLLRKSL